MFAHEQALGGKLPVRGGYQENKDLWGQYLFRTLVADAEARLGVLGRPIARRLGEVLR